MDFVIAGCVHGGLELLRNGSVSQIEEHLQRFLSGNYPTGVFALFNFDLSTPMSSPYSPENVAERLKLPSSTEYHDRIYTYVRSTNCLYKGKQLIAAPAVLAFATQPVDERVLMSGVKRSFAEIDAK